MRICRALENRREGVRVARLARSGNDRRLAGTNPGRLRVRKLQTYAEDIGASPRTDGGTTRPNLDWYLSSRRIVSRNTIGAGDERREAVKIFSDNLWAVDVVILS